MVDQGKDATDAERLEMGLENRQMELKFLSNIQYPFKKNVDSI